MPRGAGFEFHDKVVGGAVPRNYIGAVEEGVVDGLVRGPLGFPVIDVQVTLTDGSYHSVDSSDLAFRTAARLGVSEALPQCQPVLLEPIHRGRDRLSDRTPPPRSTPSCRDGAAKFSASTPARAGRAGIASAP